MPGLTRFDRYRFEGIKGRGTYVWPGGHRLAVYIGLNLETFAFGEGLGAELAPGGPQPDVLNYGWRDYGNRVGVWRLLDLFDSLALPVSVLINSAIYDDCPAVAAAFRARGDEFLGHGRSNSERQGILPEADEAALIRESTRAIVNHEGRHPKGWLGPWISESHHTPDLLQEAGYGFVLDWCMDDQPVWMRTRGGRILSVPYPQELNDIPAIVGRKMNGDAFADMIVDQFDEMMEQSADTPLVMGIALHPYIVGQPHRLRHLRRALTHIVARRDAIFITRAGAIAEHAAGLPEGVLAGSAPLELGGEQQKREIQGSNPRLDVRNQPPRAKARAPTAEPSAPPVKNVAVKAPFSRALDSAPDAKMARWLVTRWPPPRNRARSPRIREPPSQAARFRMSEEGEEEGGHACDDAEARDTPTDNAGLHPRRTSRPPCSGPLPPPRPIAPAAQEFATNATAIGHAAKAIVGRLLRADPP